MSYSSGRCHYVRAIYIIPSKYRALGRRDPQERYCEIGSTFIEGRKLLLEEGSGCIGYHGAACGFSGELLYDDAGL